MVRIQLETGYLDVKEGTAFPLNFGIGDVRDLSKRSSTFSKTIVLIGSKNNNDLLNHYYDVNIQAGTFDINALTPCTIIQNGIPVVEDAYLQLLSVNKLQSTSATEEYVEYEVLVKDAQADFFTKIDNALLEDLDFTDLNHTFNAANVVSSFTNTVTDGYVYPICATNDNWYPLKEMRPAIYAKQYWDRIHSNAGFSYTWSSLSDAYFDKLIIPFNGDAIQFDYTDYDVSARKAYTETFTQSAGTNVSGVSQIQSWTETLDAQGLFTPVTGSYAVPIYIAAGEAINFEVSVEADLNLVNGTGATAYLVEMPSATGATKYYYYKPFIGVYKNGTLLYRHYLAGIQRSEGSLANGTTTLLSYNTTFNIPATPLLPTDTLTIRAGVTVTYNSQTNNTGVSPRWKGTNSSGGTDVQIDYALDFTNISFTAGIQSTVFATGATAEMNRFIPKQIKQKDFVKSICQMYNLMVEPDQDNPNKLIYTHRDDYYDSGTEKDWSKKLAKDRDHQIQFLPELSAKKLTLTYKQDTDTPNKIYLDTTREVYSQVEYTFDNEYIRGEDKKELIFTPSPMGKTQVFGAVVPMVSGYAPKTGLRVLIHNGVGTCFQYSIYDYGTTGQTALTSYPICHHWDDPYNPNFSIEFATNDFYFYDNYQITNNTLYNLYWRRTLNQINTGKMLTAYFNLNETDIQTLKLNDKIWVYNSWWNINRVIDYDCSERALTKVELLSVDTEIDFAPFKTRTPKLPRPKLLANALKDVKTRKFESENVNYSEGGMIIRGYGNVVGEGLRGYLEGDDQG